MCHKKQKSFVPRYSSNAWLVLLVLILSNIGFMLMVTQEMSFIRMNGLQSLLVISALAQEWYPCDTSWRKLRCWHSDSHRSTRFLLVNMNMMERSSDSPKTQIPIIHHQESSEGGWANQEDFCAHEIINVCKKLEVLLHKRSILRSTNLLSNRLSILGFCLCWNSIMEFWRSQSIVRHD